MRRCKKYITILFTPQGMKRLSLTDSPLEGGMGKDLLLENITKKFDQIVAVRDMYLEVKQGEFVCFLGPSGCGKTTTLRIIAGFEFPTSGIVRYSGKIINDVIPQKRNFGIVFQSYALFPHMTVAENVGFGLKMRKVPKQQMNRRVDELLELVGLTDQKYKRPPELSGGQQQRVALVRSLATYPEILLLDEPLSALDAKIRVNLRAEIKKVQSELGITMVYVTHDQEEALSISDRVIVMNQGYIEQIDKPIEVYKNPKTKFVADFVGTSNFFSGEIRGNVVTDTVTGVSITVSQEALSTLKSQKGRVTLSIRPEKILLFEHARNIPKDVERANIIEGSIEVVTFLGVIVRSLINLKNKHLIVDITEKDFEKSLLKMGDRVFLYFPPEEFLVFQNDGRRS
jgi:ABC-type Fe3+/spermidine/putrescine transport system ATPase subunit